MKTLSIRKSLPASLFQNPEGFRDSLAKRGEGRFFTGALIMILTGLLFLLMPLTTFAAYNTWTGSGPFATGLGNRVITAMTVDPNNANIIYAGTGSGTVFQYNFPTYTLTVTKSGNGSGTVTAGANCTLNWVANTGTCTVDDGTAITLSGTADTGSTFAGWSVGTGSASGCSGTGNCAFTITQNSGITGTFTLNQYTVTPSAGPNGSISPSGAVQKNYGSAASFTIKPNAGYHVTTPVGGTCGGSYTGDPFDATNGITYTTSAVTAACTVSAAFAANNTTTAITSHTPDPSTFGQSVTFTATVTGGAGTPTGTVTFSEGATTYCSSVSLNGSGQAACSTSSLSVGSHTITATYSGGGNYNGSSGTVGQTVNKANTNTTAALTSGTNPSTFGQSVTFTATVTSGAGTPTGTVGFSEGATTYCSSVSLNGSGQAACSTSSLSVSSHTITATYSGDVNYNGSSGTVGQTVNAVAPTVTTAAVTSITSSSATSGGNVTSDGSSPVTARGICYGTSPNPTIAGSHTTDGTGAGSFISSMSGLAQNTIYHVRAYATNGMGTSYGSDISFTTNLLTHIVIAAATGNGNITLDTNSPGCLFTAWGTKTEAQVGNDGSYYYPYGLVEFTLNCAAADVTITFPGNIAGTTYRKYGPTTPGNPATTAWYTFNNFTVNSSTSITLHFQDGQLGDDTGVDGIIVDEGGPGQPGGNGAVAVPTMTEWGMIIFVVIAGLGSIYYLRRQGAVKMGPGLKT